MCLRRLAASLFVWEQNDTAIFPGGSITIIGSYSTVEPFDPPMQNIISSYSYRIVLGIVI